MSQVECYKNIFNQEYSQLNSRLLSLYLLSFVRAFYNARIFIKFSFFFRLISSLQFCFFTVSSPAFLECLLCLTNAILGDVCTFPLSSTHIIYVWFLCHPHITWVIYSSPNVHDDHDLSPSFPPHGPLVIACYFLILIMTILCLLGHMWAEPFSLLIHHCSSVLFPKTNNKDAEISLIKTTDDDSTNKIQIRTIISVFFPFLHLHKQESI